jgi:hypothetical protein
MESKLSNPEKSGFVTVDFDPELDYDKEIEKFRNTIANIKDIVVKMQIYENKLGKLAYGWNPYLIDVKAD